MTNSGGAGADDIGFHILNPALPLAPKPAPPKQRTAIELKPDVLARYVGTYQLAPNFTLEITLKDDALWVHPTSQATLRLWPETETDFFLKELVLSHMECDSPGIPHADGPWHLPPARMPWCHRSTRST